MADEDEARPFGYRYCGLRVAANFDWPELAPFALDGALEAVDITIDRVPSEPLAAGIAPRRARLVVAGVGGYEICEGRSIRVQPEPQASLEAVQLFLFGSAWGLLCYQRGVVALHASVVGVRGEALALCGPSGSGKSTLAAGLVGRGHTLLSDDLCRVALVDGGPRVWPSLPRLKLWRASLEQLGQPAGPLTADVHSLDKFNLPPVTPRQKVPLPLRAVYLLEWGEPACERLRGSQALRQFVAASLYRGEALAAMGRLAWYWESCAALLKTCAVYRLRRPRRWEAWEQVIDQIEAGATR
jgi:hypothetical protein